MDPNFNWAGAQRRDANPDPVLRLENPANADDWSLVQTRKAVVRQTKSGKRDRPHMCEQLQTYPFAFPKNYQSQIEIQLWHAWWDALHVCVTLSVCPVQTPAIPSFFLLCTKDDLSHIVFRRFKNTSIIYQLRSTAPELRVSPLGFKFELWRSRWKVLHGMKINAACCDRMWLLYVPSWETQEA